MPRRPRASTFLPAAWTASASRSKSATWQPSPASRSEIADPIPPAGTCYECNPVGQSTHRRSAPHTGEFLGEIGFALLAQAVDTFAHLVTRESHELESQRRIEGRSREAQPVVERVLG